MRGLVLLTAAAAASTVLTACGGDDDTAPTTDGLAEGFSVSAALVGERLGHTAADVRSFADLRDGLDRFAVHRLQDDAEVRDDLHRTGEGDPGDLDPEAMAGGGQFPMVNVVAEKDGAVAYGTEPSQVEGWKAGRGKRLESNEELSDVAAALDESTPVVHLAYRFEDDAQAGADQLEKMWTDGTSRRTNQPLSDLVELRDVTTSGDVVTVALDASSRGPDVVLQMLTAADTPFQGE